MCSPLLQILAKTYRVKVRFSSAVTMFCRSLIARFFTAPISKFGSNICNSDFAKRLEITKIT